MLTRAAAPRAPFAQVRAVRAAPGDPAPLAPAAGVPEYARADVFWRALGVTLGIVLAFALVVGLMSWSAIGETGDCALLRGALVDGALRVTVTYGSPPRDVDALVDASLSAVVVQAALIAESRSYDTVSARDWLQFDGTYRQSVVVAPPDAAQDAALRAASAQIILGLGPESSLWARWRCAQLAATDARLCPRPCNAGDYDAAYACDPLPGIGVPAPLCTVSGAAFFVPGPVFIADPPQYNAVVYSPAALAGDLDAMPDVTIGPLAIPPSAYVNPARTTPWLLAPGDSGVPMRVLLAYGLAYDAQTRVLYTRAAEITPFISIYVAALAALAAPLLVCLYCSDEGHLGPFQPPEARLHPASRAALGATAGYASAAAIGALATARLWTLHMGAADYALLLLHALEALIGAGAAFAGLLGSGALRFPGQALAVELAIWLAPWLVLAPYTQGAWTALVPAGITAAVSILRLRRAELYLAARRADTLASLAPARRAALAAVRIPWYAAVYIYAGAVLHLVLASYAVYAPLIDGLVLAPPPVATLITAWAVLIAAVLLAGAAERDLATAWAPQMQAPVNKQA